MELPSQPCPKRAETAAPAHRLWCKAMVYRLTITKYLRGQADTPRLSADFSGKAPAIASIHRHYHLRNEHSGAPGDEPSKARTGRR